jgi:hypothetical protein
MRGPRKRTKKQIWSRAHGNKPLHETISEAEVEQARRSAEEDDAVFVIYPCTWSNDYMSGIPATEHYHVGKKYNDPSDG